MMDLDLLEGWLGARSVARGLPLPVRAHGGLRLDANLPNETRRYVFAGAAPAIGELAAAITAPRIFIKACIPGAALQEMVPARWRLQPPSYVMVHPGAPARDAVPVPGPGYRVEVVREGPVFAARVHAQDGTLAASGYAIEHGGLFVYDRISTHEAHRRRGLGRTLMLALGSLQQANDARRLLVATEEGRALYSTLGWTVLAPYSTVVIPDPAG